MQRKRQSPRILIIAGPNGAGKTTFATEYLIADEKYLRFINADLIASCLNPLEPSAAAFKAGRLMIETMEELTERGDSFAFETTLSGRVYRQWIPSWQQAGYRVTIDFLYLQSSSLAIKRVAGRVRGGGHHVPDSVVRRRYVKGWQDFVGVYRDLVDDWTVYDTSDTVPVVNSESKRESELGEIEVWGRAERAREVEGALTALNRAATVAHQRAAVRGDKVAIWKDGNVVWIDPNLEH